MRHITLALAVALGLFAAQPAFADDEKTYILHTPGVV